MNSPVNPPDQLNHSVPLCVDLDGTLVRTDFLLETAIVAIRNHWPIIFQLPFWFLTGKARAKSKLAKFGTCNLETIPWNEEFINYLKKEHEKGRRIVLATASDRSIAESVALPLGIFEEVISSDGITNIKGEAKAKVLVDRYSEHGFDYAGNDNSDLPVWKRARTALIVNARSNVSKSVAKLVHVEHEFGRRRPVILGLIKGCRIYQWIKNILVFIPMVVAHRLFEKSALFPSLLTFAGFCAAASGIYLINDLMDLEADRLHPRKRYRPFASGELPLQYGVVGLFLITIAITIGLVVSRGILSIILLYITLSLVYSNFIKTKPLADVFCLAALYLLRVIAGGFASGSHASVWLLNFSGFLFLSLGFLKRYAEYPQSDFESTSKNVRRGYKNFDSLLIIIMGVSSSFLSSMVLGLYVNSAQAQYIYQTPFLLWGFVPLVLYWQCRMWLATIRGNMHDDPILYAAKDRISYLIVALLILIYIAASFNLNLGYFLN